MAHADHKAWCRAKGIQACPRFEEKKFFPRGDWVKLTQQMAKGAQTLQLVRWLYDVCLRPGVSVGDHGELRLALLHSAVTFENVYRDNERIIPAADLIRAQEATEDFLACLNALATEAVIHDKWTWHITPKAHMVLHMALDFAPQANPRKTQCYSDEDMVGRMKRIISRCHGMTAAAMGLL
eukprot:9497599-Pyramimonas_sp.AAC.1